MRELSIRSGRAFILVFSVDSLQSFHEVVALWELVIKIRGNINVPVVLVGNKADLECDRQVEHESVGQTKLELMNNCPYIETRYARHLDSLYLWLINPLLSRYHSAKYNQNVARLFMELLQQARSLDGTSTPEMKRHRKLSRRLSSFSSLPNITLIRRKSSGNSQKMNKNGELRGGNNNKLTKNDNSNDSSTTEVNNKNSNALVHTGRCINNKQLGLNRTLNGLKGLNNPITGSYTGVNKLVDNDMIEIKRAIINGMDTISLSDGCKTPPDQKCTIL